MKTKIGGEYTEFEYKIVQTLISDALKAEELIDIDELEEYAIHYKRGIENEDYKKD